MAPRDAWRGDSIQHGVWRHSGRGLHIRTILLDGGGVHLLPAVVEPAPCGVPHVGGERRGHDGSLRLQAPALGLRARLAGRATHAVGAAAQAPLHPPPGPSLQPLALFYLVGSHRRLFP